MPYLVQAADEVTDIRPRRRSQTELWLLRWRVVIALILVGLLLG